MKNANANTSKQEIKVTTLCKVLLQNAKYTNRFVGKSHGEALFNTWIGSLKTLKASAFAYYKAEAEQAEASVIAEAEKALYTEIRSLLSLVGDIPTSDGKESTKLSAKVLFLDSIAFAVNHKAKQEIEALTKAREALKTAKKEYKDNCLTADGFLKKGLNDEYIKAREQAIKDANASIEKLLNKANASVFSTAEVKIGTFAKNFEIALRKAVSNQYHFTAEQAKAEKEAKKQEREANRGKKRGGKQAKAKPAEAKAEPKAEQEASKEAKAS
jgi:hypothetical protein